MRLTFFQDRSRDADNQSKVMALSLRIRAYRYTSLYVGHSGMLVNGFYIHYGYIHVCHSIFFVVTCMICVS